MPLWEEIGIAQCGCGEVKLDKQYGGDAVEVWEKKLPELETVVCL